MEYVTFKVSDAANMEYDPIIKELMNDLAEYLYAEEWYLSGDTGRDSYSKARKKFKNKWCGKKAIDYKRFIDEEIEAVRKKLYDMVEE